MRENAKLNIDILVEEKINLRAVNRKCELELLRIYVIAGCRVTNVKLIERSCENKKLIRDNVCYQDYKVNVPTM